jgi:hypothetical protein
MSDLRGIADPYDGPKRRTVVTANKILIFGDLEKLIRMASSVKRQKGKRLLAIMVKVLFREQCKVLKQLVSNQPWKWAGTIARVQARSRQVRALRPSIMCEIKEKATYIKRERC